MDNRVNLDEARKRRRDAGHDSETTQRQQQRDVDGTSMFLMSESDDDARPTVNKSRRVDAKNASKPSTLPNARLPQQIPVRKPSQVNSVNGTASTPKQSLPKSTPSKVVKEEPAEEFIWTEVSRSPDSVTIYVGKRNAQLSCKRTDLVKSPVLNSWIVDDSQQGAYIMRPQLLRLDLNDFEAVLQYVHSGEYKPMLIDNVENPAGPKILDGLKADENYAQELVRSGRIHVIAQDLQVDGMVEHVYRKVTEVDQSKFTNQSLVDLATVVFRNNRNIPTTDVTTPTTDEQSTPSQHDGPLEKWIVGQLAKNFREIMTTTQFSFWRMERNTSKRYLLAQVLEEVAKQYRDNGSLPSSCIELE